MSKKITKKLRKLTKGSPTRGVFNALLTTRASSRYKGPSEAELVREVRERAKEDAVVGYGRAYGRRPGMR